MKLTLQVQKDLVKRLKKLDTATVAAKCDIEIEKRVKYLETILNGWKTFKHVKEDHSRILYLLLMSDNKDGLHDYEKCILFPKIVELENAAGPQTTEESKPTIVESENASGATTSKELEFTKVESVNVLEPQTNKKSKPSEVEPKNVSGPQTNKKSKPTKVNLGNTSTPQTSNKPNASKENKNVGTAHKTEQEPNLSQMELENTVGAQNNNKKFTPTDLEMGSVGGSESGKEPTTSALEINKVGDPEKPAPAKVLDVGSTSSSTTSSIDLGAESSESSNGEDSGSSSPTVEYQPLINEEKIVTPKIVIEDYDDKMFKKPIGRAPRSRASLNSTKNNASEIKDNAPSTSDGSQTKNMVVSEKRLPNISETVDSEEIQEDESVVGAEGNDILSKKLAMAVQQMKEALGNVNVVGNNSTTIMTKMNFSECKLTESANKMVQKALGGNAFINVVDYLVNEEVNREVNRVVNDDETDNTVLSQGAKKRRKKAAKKAAAIAEAEQKKIEKEKNYQNQVMKAKEALKIWDQSKTEKEKEKKPELISPDLPMTTEELGIYHKIYKSGQTVFEEGSKEKAVMEKYEANKDILKAYIHESYSAEEKYNKICMDQIRELNEELEELEKKPLTDSEQHDKAIAFVIKKLSLWKKSKSIQAGYYVDMYAYFLENMTPSIAQIISGFVPYEYLPNANFEHTLLLRYQAGKFHTQTI
ncbi:hypothetical protein CAEBREN_10113 [Caenorhabditis brenneri]|uniref:Uncharacterized protein n=1 Tax=Caenorhabditis brenneri TaxID=135651 RepID=G0M710_CAEBE|nr:hypothetical protein CAEBREN_10113 [Caenorhabditis brenneri]